MFSLWGVDVDFVVYEMAVGHFVPRKVLFPIVSTIASIFHSRLQLNTALSEGQRGEGWEICNKAIIFRVSGSVVQNLSSSYVFGFHSSLLIFVSSFGVRSW